MNKILLCFLSGVVLVILLTACGTAQIGFEQEQQSSLETENELPEMELQPITGTSVPEKPSPTAVLEIQAHETINSNDPGLVFFLSRDPEQRFSMDLAYLPLDCFDAGCPDVYLISGLPFNGLFVNDRIVMAPSPGRAWFAIVLGQTDKKLSRLYLQNLMDAEWQEPFSFSMPVRDISWKEDEKKLALLSSWMAENSSFYSIQLYDVISQQSTSVFEQTEKLPSELNNIFLAGWSAERLYFVRNFRDKNSELWFYSLESQSLELALEMDGFILNGKVSPDGKQLLFGFENQGKTDLAFLNLEDNSIETLIGFYDKSIGSLNWSGDGQQIVFTITQENYLPDLSEIMVYSFPTGKLQQMLSLPESRISEVLFDPSGDYIVFDTSSLRGDRQIAALSLLDGEIVLLKKNDQESWLMPVFR